MSNGGNMSKGSRQNKRPAPLKMVKEEVRQIRLPVIIHTHSPEVIHVDPAQFSKIVQDLTGRGQKRKPEASPRVRDFAEEFCQSPSSSADSGLAGILDGPHGLMSPRTHLPSIDHLYHGLDSFLPPLQPSPDKNNKMLSNKVLAAAAKTAANAAPPYSPFFQGNFNAYHHLFSPLPSPNIISPNFLSELPMLSPSTNPAFDTFSPHHSLIPSPGYGRFSTAGLFASSGTNNAFLDIPMIRE